MICADLLCSVLCYVSALVLGALFILLCLGWFGVC